VSPGEPQPSSIHSEVVRPEFGSERIALVATLLATVGVPVLVALEAVVERGLGRAPHPVVAVAFGFAGVLVLTLLARRGRGPLAAVAARLSPGWDGAARRRPVVAALWLVLAVAGAAQTTRLSCFMADPAHRWGSTYPPVDEGVTHACMAAYVQAADLSRRDVDNLYADEYYPAYLGGTLGHSQRMPSPVANLSSWLEDPYEYPPPFLLLPRAGLALTNDYLVLRPAWFAIKLLLAAAIMLAIAAALGGRRGRAAMLLAPALIASLSFMFDMQFGQFHFVAIALSMAGMLAFGRDRHVLGGALLGAAIVCKLFPGILVLYLLAQRRWRPVISTAAWSLAWVLLGLAVLGWAPYEAFFDYQLPRISSGEAFAFFLRSDLTIASNWGIYGLPIKLGRLGVPGMTTEVASVLSWLYTIPVVVVAVLAARRRGAADVQPLFWLALLCLGSLRSPLAPNVYIGAPALWLLALVAVDARSRWAIASVVAVWLCIGGLPPLPGPEATIVLWMTGQAAMLALCFWTVLRRPRPAEAA